MEGSELELSNASLRQEVAELRAQFAASADVLKVISRSTFDLQAVLDTLTQTAASLCEADMAGICRRAGDGFYYASSWGFPPDWIEYNRDRRLDTGRGSVVGRVLLDGAPAHLADVFADPEYSFHDGAIKAGFRTFLGIPLIREGRAIGVLVLGRCNVSPFSERQISLVQTFADQAVIAIENVRLFDEVQQRTVELAESLSQQTATSDVLKVISRSAFDLTSVLQTLVDSAVHLCDADMGAITLREGDTLRFMAGVAQAPELLAYERAHPHPVGRGTFQGRAALEGVTVHVPDVFLDAEYERPEAAVIGNFRAVLSVPLRRGGEVIGVFGLAKKSVGPFAQRQIELVETFADQAVIAIENVRLFEEAQARTRDLTESLEQQTATGAILSVIASSPTDLQPVLKAVVETATRLCDSYDAALMLREGDNLVLGAHFGPIPVDFTKFPVARDWVAGRSVVDARTVQVNDLLAAGDEFASGQAMAVRQGHRTTVACPLLREGAAIGTIVLRRIEIRPFTEKQVELLKTFADQAVIAIGNVRLFEEVQTRTAELTEALAQQTATADVLKVISRSAFDLQGVLQTLIDSAARLCAARSSAIFMRDGDVFRIAASYSNTPEHNEYERAHPSPISRASWVGRAALEKAVVHVPDVSKDPEHGYPEAARIGGYKAVLCVPLMREGMVIGVFALTRPETGPFADRQIELIKTFADQAVIAIENVRLFDEVQARNREISEALEQQTATSNILRAIAASPTDIQPVLQVVVESATRFCDTYDAVILLAHEGKLTVNAHYGPIPPTTAPFPIDRRSVSGRACLDRETIHVHDALASGAEFPAARTMALIAGHRTLVATPLLRDNEAIGTLVIRRTEVRPFSEKQIELLKTFADQAVIAIQNVRLFEEVQARSAELREALTQQTATADVLKLISRSTFDLQAVLDALAISVTRLCEADYAAIIRQSGDRYLEVANHGLSEEFKEYIRDVVFEPGRATAAGRVLLEGRTVQIPDALADPDFNLLEGQRLSGFRTLLGVPMLRETVPVGVFVLMRSTVKQFTDKQIELVETFADQAVIAIENVRLFEEVQERNREVSDALERQTATAAVLRVIAASPTDIQPVLDVVVESAARLCETHDAVIFLEHDGMLEKRAHFGPTPLDLEPVPIGRDWVTGRAFVDRETVHVHDLIAEGAEFPLGRSFAEQAGHRTTLATPLLRDEKPIGALVIRRNEVRPFSDRQIELLRTFADQAAIAIQNVRLFEEVQARTADLSEALGQQTVTADVLKVISRSAFDLQSVLDTLVQSAARVCEADKGVIYRRDGELFRFTANYGFSEQMQEYSRAHPHRAGRGSAAGRAVLEARTIHIPDVLADPEYSAVGYQQLGGYHTVLAIPLFREGAPIGVFVLTRSQARPFSMRQIELVETFADQAVIAIENVRLFEEVRARTDELSLSLEDLRTAQDRLVQTEKLASLGQLTAGIAHEIKNPLNFVNNFAALSSDLIQELSDGLSEIQVGGDQRSTIDELIKMLKANLAKVEQHGKRADSIVKNMLLHSRQGSGERRMTGINAVVEESLNLAYHGARAETQGFNITLVRDLDPDAGEVDLYPQEITRVLLNLISNGFYATSKRRDQANGAPYDPVLTASTRNLGDRVEIRIRDNGTGIPHQVRDKMFEPFFTTKPAGEGTGLGLSLSHEIVVKQHAGSIGVATEPGEFTEFTIVLPRHAATAARSGDAG